MPGNGGEMINPSVAVPVPVALIAPRATLNVPVSAGVPEINPLSASRASPSGNPAAV